jgi:hypothetical protein
MPVRGKLHTIPLNENQATPEFLVAKEHLSDKELDALLSGETAFNAALKSK